MRRAGPAKDRAVARGINKTQNQTTTHAGREIRKRERSLTARTVNNQLYKQRATPKRLFAVIRARGKPIPLKHFKGTRVVKGRGKRRGYVTVQVIPGEKKRVQGGFQGPNDHIFRRQGRKRLPIKKLYGPSVPSAFVKSSIERAMRTKAQQVGPRLIEGQLRFELNKL